jgi:predicted acetyltransferase
MMRHQLDDIARRGTEPVALLWASESLIYGRYGYGHAAPRIQVSGATRDMGFLPSIEPAPGSVDEVSKVEFMASAAELRRRLLPDRPGALNRSEAWWDVALYDPESLRNGASAQRFALHFDRSGTVDGYAVFRTKEGDKAEIPGKEVQIGDLDASNSRAYAALWRYVLDLDLVRRFVRRCAPADEPLRYLVADQRAIKTEVLDGTYARIIDVPAALEGRRYHRELDTVVEVHDHMVSVTRTRRKPDVSLSARELGAIYLGGTSLDWLDRAGLVEEHKHGTVSALAAAFSWPRPPFCVDFF